MDTTKVRVLKGFIYANETRNIEIEENSQQKRLLLTCRRFWNDEPVMVYSDGANGFNYQENFSVINDDKLLKRMEKQYLNLELWQISEEKRAANDDILALDNLKHEERRQPVGVVHIPLHQFFIAFRNADITNRICKEQLPVISIDAWTSIVKTKNSCQVGEIRCLLAMGSDNQMNHLKMSRGFEQKCTPSICNAHLSNGGNRNVLQNTQKASLSIDEGNTLSMPLTSKKQASDWLNMLQRALVKVPHTNCSSETNSPDNVFLKPLQQSNVKLFKFILEVQRATFLTLYANEKTCKKISYKQHMSKRISSKEPSNYYVTFQADEGQYPLYKSYEGQVYATTVSAKSIQPQWQQRFRLATSVDYLYNAQKRFILKVWKKSVNDLSSETCSQPTPLADCLVGFAALNLTAFLKGVNIVGYFNIVDFNGRVNGQLYLSCQSLEDLRYSVNWNYNDNSYSVSNRTVDSVIDQFEESMELTHLNLKQAIKRKFNELEDISQRLRARLGDIAGIALPTEFNYAAIDKWQKMKEDELNEKDEFYEFQRYLNTPCKVDDLDYDDENKDIERMESRDKREIIRLGATTEHYNDTIDSSE